MLSPQKMYRLNKDATVLRHSDEGIAAIKKMNELLCQFLTAKGIDISVLANMPDPEKEIDLIDELCDSQDFRDTQLEKDATSISNNQMMRLDGPRNIVFIEHLPGNVTDSIILMGGKLYTCRTAEIQEITDEVIAEDAALEG